MQLGLTDQQDEDGIIVVLVNEKKLLKEEREHE
jgi:hypothetical protein